MSLKLLSNLLCKNKKKKKTQKWGRSTTATAKKRRLSGRLEPNVDNFRRKIAEPEISYGRALHFFIFIIIIIY